MVCPSSTESESPVEVFTELAPPNRLRREGPDIWIGVPPERCAHKQKSERLLPRSLLEKMKRATAEDGEFHVRLECRRSSRLTPSIPSASPDLGDGGEGLTPIEEGLEPIEVFRPIVKGEGMMMASPSPCSGPSALSSGAAIRHCQTTTEDDGGREMALGPLRVSGAHPGGVDSERKEAELQVSLVVNSVVDGAQEVRLDGGEMSQVRAVSADEVLSSPCLSMLGSSAVNCPASEAAGVADVVGAGESQKPASSLVPPTVSYCDCVAEQRDAVVRDGGEQLLREELGVSKEGSEPLVDGGAGSGGLVKTAATVCSYLHCLPSVLDSLVGSCAVGCVREEVRVPQMSEEALRPQPTDGLWQPPSTSVGPVSERVEKEKGILGDACVAQEGRGGVQASRTYAHGVHADRRADLELSFIPPVDGGPSPRVGSVLRPTVTPEVGEVSRFAPLSELDEDASEDVCGAMGDSDREGHRLDSSCVDALLDAAEVTGDRRGSASGKKPGRGRGGRRGGGSTRGRGAPARGRGRS
ncbi:hypothetical protein Dimus_030467 [Dionaea muscipula]